MMGAMGMQAARARGKHVHCGRVWDGAAYTIRDDARDDTFGSCFHSIFRLSYTHKLLQHRRCAI